MQPTEVTNNAVSLGFNLGTNAFNGSSGIFNILNVQGTGNIVETNMIMNIIMVESGANLGSVMNLVNQLGPQLNTQ